MNHLKQDPFQARLKKLNQQKGFLGKLNQVLPWEEFLSILAKIRDKPHQSRAVLDELIGSFVGNGGGVGIGVTLIGSKLLVKAKLRIS